MDITTTIAKHASCDQDSSIISAREQRIVMDELENQRQVRLYIMGAVV